MAMRMTTGTMEAGRGDLLGLAGAAALSAGPGPTTRRRRARPATAEALEPPELREDDDGEPEPRCCRICFCGPEPDDDVDEEEVEDEELIAPCACTGSCRWVHRSCLDAWRTRSCAANAIYTCATCKAPFLLEASREATVAALAERVSTGGAHLAFGAVVVAHLYLSSCSSAYAWLVAVLLRLLGAAAYACLMTAWRANFRWSRDAQAFCLIHLFPCARLAWFLYTSEPLGIGSLVAAVSESLGLCMVLCSLYDLHGHVVDALRSQALCPSSPPYAIATVFAIAIGNIEVVKHRHLPAGGLTMNASLQGPVLPRVRCRFQSRRAHA